MLCYGMLCYMLNVIVFRSDVMRQIMAYVMGCRMALHGVWRVMGVMRWEVDLLKGMAQEKSLKALEVSHGEECV